MKNYPAKLLS